MRTEVIDTTMTFDSAHTLEEVAVRLHAIFDYGGEEERHEHIVSYEAQADDSLAFQRHSTNTALTEVGHYGAMQVVRGIADTHVENEVGRFIEPDV